MGLFKAIVNALKPKVNKTIGINSPSGIRFWVYIDNILQNQHSETSRLIYDIPVNDDATSLLEVTLDLGNGNIAKVPGVEIKLTSITVTVGCRGTISGVSPRALVRSISVTRGSWRSW